MTISIPMFFLAFFLTSCCTSNQDSYPLKGEFLSGNEEFLKISISLDVDTTFTLDYKIFSKICYNPSFGNDIKRTYFNSLIEAKNELLNSALLVENKKGDVYPYAWTNNCNYDNIDIYVNCTADWLQEIKLGRNEVFELKVPISCIEDFRLQETDKYVKLHYIFLGGKSLLGTKYSRFEISSDWISLN